MGLQSGMIEFEVDQTQLQRIELKLKELFGKNTHVGIHVEPVK